ncbi:MAG: 4-demethylwyosine synthase TYW1 [Methanobacteriota archaeon]
MRDELRTLLAKQGYGVIGNHAAIKLCHWSKAELKEGRRCYKGDFYGIESHRCMQMTPIVDFCNQLCLFCWRSQDFDPGAAHDFDDPKAILDGMVHEQHRLLSGYKGNPKVAMEKWLEAMAPKHVAISLNGEPAFYPHLAEFIRLCDERGLTTFLVTNGTAPQAIRRLAAEDALPTQLYVSVNAPNEDVYNRLCVPTAERQWDALMETLRLLPSLECRTVARHVLVKGWNMFGHEAEYEALDRISEPDFIECKAYVWVGYSRERLSIDNMPAHADILRFSNDLAGRLGYDLRKDRADSRVALLVRPGSEPDLVKDGVLAPEPRPEGVPDFSPEPIRSELPVLQ